VSDWHGERLAFIDLDGVVADDRHRVHFAMQRAWFEYFSLMHLDKVWPQGRELYDSCTAAGFDLAYLTGRREDTRQVTRGWLHQHRFDATLPLIMRKLYDRRPLAELKAAIVAEALAFGYREVWIYDDDPHVIEHARQVKGATARHCTWYTKPERMIKRGRT